MKQKLDEKCFLIVGDFRDKSIYVDDFSSEVKLNSDKGHQVIKKAGLTCHFIARAHDPVILSDLRARRDEIKENFITNAETIKIYADQEIALCEGIFIGGEGQVSLLYEQEVALPADFGMEPFE